MKNEKWRRIVVLCPSGKIYLTFNIQQSTSAVYGNFFAFQEQIVYL